MIDGCSSGREGARESDGRGSDGRKQEADRSSFCSALDLSALLELCRETSSPPTSSSADSWMFELHCVE